MGFTGKFIIFVRVNSYSVERRKRKWKWKNNRYT